MTVCSLLRYIIHHGANNYTGCVRSPAISSAGIAMLMLAFCRLGCRSPFEFTVVGLRPPKLVRRPCRSDGEQDSSGDPVAGTRLIASCNITYSQ